MAKGSFFVPDPPQPPAKPLTGKQRLAQLITGSHGPRITRQSGAGVHADQHGAPPRERARSAARRAAIRRDLDA